MEKESSSLFIVKGRRESRSVLVPFMAHVYEPWFFSQPFFFPFCAPLLKSSQRRWRRMKGKRKKNGKCVQLVQNRTHQEGRKRIEGWKEVVLLSTGKTWERSTTSPFFTLFFSGFSLMEGEGGENEEQIYFAYNMGPNFFLPFCQLLWHKSKGKGFRTSSAQVAPQFPSRFPPLPSLFFVPQTSPTSPTLK